VAVKIKLKRLGKIREPYYRIVVADARTKRDGRAIEEIGQYHPKLEPSLIKVDSERALYWLSVGAQPSHKVQCLLNKQGVKKPAPGEPWQVAETPAAPAVAATPAAAPAAETPQTDAS